MYLRSTPYFLVVFFSVSVFFIQGGALACCLFYKQVSKELKRLNIDPKNTILRNTLAFYLIYYDVFILLITIYCRDSFLCKIRKFELTNINVGVFTLNNDRTDEDTLPPVTKTQIETFSMLVGQD